MNFNFQYYRKDVYSLERVMPFIYTVERAKLYKLENSLIDYDGDAINMSSPRLVMFLKKGVICVACGLKGTFFAKERDRYGTNTTSRYHLNLYGLKDGFEVQLTKDHIFPEHAGGSNNLNNLQPLCVDCNHKKDGVLPFSFEEAVAQNLVTDFAISTRIPVPDVAVSKA